MLNHLDTLLEVDGLVANVGARGLLITVSVCRQEAEQLMERYED